MFKHIHKRKTCARCCCDVGRRSGLLMIIIQRMMVFFYRCIHINTRTYTHARALLLV